MRVVALLGVRNEALYLERCLDHLYDQGIETCLIDNGSTDRSLEIAESYRDRGVFRIEHVPYPGRYVWRRILARKEELAAEIEADWFIHHDGDEIRESRDPAQTLHDALEAIDAEGYNAADFDEFVFLPARDDPPFRDGDYVSALKRYIYLQPRSLHRVNAWKALGLPVDLCSRGGHEVRFPGRRIHPRRLVLRHYVVLNRAHALRKYAGRVYDMDEVDKRGWSTRRAAFSPGDFALPRASELKLWQRPGAWDRSDPWPGADFLSREPDRQSMAREVVQRVRDRLLKRSAPSPVRSPGAAQPPMPFLVGVSRSGTTLLRFMLDAHPALAIPPETHFMLAALELRRWRFGHKRKLLAHMLASPTWSSFGVDVATLRSRLDAQQPFDLSEAVRCFYRLYAGRFGKSRWGDKTPGYLRHMRGIAELLPEARFVHVLRDGRDVATSFRKMWWGPGDDMEAQAAHWLWHIRVARQQAQYCPHYLEVRFERLVSEPATVLREVCDFIDIPYCDQMLRYHEGAVERLAEMGGRQSTKTAPAVARAEVHRIHDSALSAPDPNRIGVFRDQLTTAQIAAYETVAGEMLRDLGYSE